MKKLGVYILVTGLRCSLGVLLVFLVSKLLSWLGVIPMFLIVWFCTLVFDLGCKFRNGTIVEFSRRKRRNLR